MNITWRIIPLDTPRIIKKCSRCNTSCGFISTNQFRINAQQKKLDIWLIWHCEKCGYTWNMEIFSRIKSSDINYSLYNRFLSNDTELAYQYAFDSSRYAGSKTEVRYDHIGYAVEGPALCIEMLKTDTIQLLIQSPYDMHLRLDRLLCEQIGINRAEIRDYFQTGAITCDAYGFNTQKSRIRIQDHMRVNLNL
jgi:hypothetical protein